MNRTECKKAGTLPRRKSAPERETPKVAFSAEELVFFERRQTQISWNRRQFLYGGGVRVSSSNFPSSGLADEVLRNRKAGDGGAVFVVDDPYMRRIFPAHGHAVPYLQMHTYAAVQPQTSSTRFPRTSRFRRLQTQRKA